MSQRRKSPTSRPFSIRLTAAELADLEARAEGQPVGTYVKGQLFPTDAPVRERRVAVRPPTVDRQAIGKVLGALGSSRLASNLNQLAKAANQGALPVTEEVEKDLKAAFAEVADIRVQLLAALGVTRTDLAGGTAPLTQLFNSRAGGAP